MRVAHCLSLNILALATGAVLLVLTVGPALAASPYKVTISGPRLDGAIEVWWARDEEALKALISGLASISTVESPMNPPKPSYELNWYFGRCWVNSTPCTEDPGRFTVHRTRYTFDPKTENGAILHVDTPAWLGSLHHDKWYRTPEEFDRAMQRVLTEHGGQLEAVAAALPQTGAAATPWPAFILAA